MRNALATREIGAVLYAYRAHPWHGRVLTQRQVGGWAGFTQGQVSRIESGVAPVHDLDRLAHWARVLRIPGHLLWFTPPRRTGRTARSGTGAVPQPGAMDRRCPDQRRDRPADRRDVLRLAATITEALITDHALAVEPDLMHTALDTGTLSEDRITTLEHTANRLGVSHGVGDLA